MLNIEGVGQGRVARPLRGARRGEAKENTWRPRICKAKRSKAAANYHDINLYN
ncbi:hypothetical protein E24_00410 [Faustovirus]|nr:hypothetical protein PRJ_Fausto_00386 [Faustovirus]AMN83325.1 hypothetical protein E24_00410 [Faustovirus]AMN84309.1 hypothetical protein D5a_00409 [Faustovirus]QBR99291.1 hypothetical protein [Faustovirus mariensis]